MTTARTISSGTSYGDISVLKGRDGVFLLVQSLPSTGRKMNKRSLRFGSEQALALCDMLAIARKPPVDTQVAVWHKVYGQSEAEYVELCNHPFSHVVALMGQTPGYTPLPFDMVMIDRYAINELIEAIGAQL